MGNGPPPRPLASKYSADACALRTRASQTFPGDLSDAGRDFWACEEQPRQPAPSQGQEELRARKGARVVLWNPAAQDSVTGSAQRPLGSVYALYKLSVYFHKKYATPDSTACPSLLQSTGASVPVQVSRSGILFINGLVRICCKSVPYRPRRTHVLL